MPSSPDARCQNPIGRPTSANSKRPFSAALAKPDALPRAVNLRVDVVVARRRLLPGAAADGPCVSVAGGPAGSFGSPERFRRIEVEFDLGAIRVETEQLPGSGTRLLPKVVL